MWPRLVVLNEGVEMNPPLRLNPGAGEEGVHQHRLAASDLAPQVDAPRCRRASVLQEFRKQPILAISLLLKRLRQLFEPVDGRRLRKILLQDSRLEPLLVVHPNAHCAGLWRGPIGEASFAWRYTEVTEYRRRAFLPRAS